MLFAGTWIMTVKSSLGNGTPSFMPEQNGDKVTGTYKGQLGEQPVMGTVTGNEVMIKYSGASQGVSLDVTYAGTVDGNMMSGKVTFGSFGEGTFTGEKQ